MIKPTIKDLPNVNRLSVGKSFTDADDAAVCQMHAQRMPVSVIAEKLGRTEAAIKARVERLGLKKGVRRG